MLKKANFDTSLIAMNPRKLSDAANVYRCMREFVFDNLPCRIAFWGVAPEFCLVREIAMIGFPKEMPF